MSWMNVKNLSIFQELLAKQPNEPEVWCGFAYALQYGHSNHRGAVDAYRRALELKPDHATALNNLGYLYANVFKDRDGAEGCYRKAIASNPT